ncbi:MAG: hypothetical protein LUG12_00615 [Erysipelotrichaceae bacterium]|nr:hypothetical protein [Erysipelotrichaceae bacterium]
MNILRIALAIVFILIAIGIVCTGHPIILSIYNIIAIYVLGFLMSSNQEFITWYNGHWYIIMVICISTWLFAAMDLQLISTLTSGLASIILTILISGIINPTSLDSLLRVGLGPLALLCIPFFLFASIQS